MLFIIATLGRQYNWNINLHRFPPVFFRLFFSLSPSKQLISLKHSLGKECHIKINWKKKIRKSSPAFWISKFKSQKLRENMKKKSILCTCRQENQPTSYFSAKQQVSKKISHERSKQCHTPDYVGSSKHLFSTHSAVLTSHTPSLFKHSGCVRALLLGFPECSMDNPF